MKNYARLTVLFKGTVVYGLMGSLRTFIEFLLLPVYARFLRPADFGMLDILIIFITIGGVASILELFNGVFRFYFDDNAGGFRRKVVSSATLLVTVNGVMIFLLASIFSKDIASLLFKSPQLGHLFIMAGAYIMLDASLTIPLCLTRIENRPGRYAFITSLQIGTLIMGLLVFIVLLRWGVAGIMMAKVSSIILPVAICFYWGRKYIGFEFDFGLLKSMLRYSVPLISAGAAIWGINSINRFFMLHYLSLDQIGLFSVGSKFVVIITLSVIAFQLAWPHFAFSNMNTKNAGKMFAHVFNVFAGLGAWLVLFLTLFGQILIQIATTPDYYPAARVIMPLSLGMFLYGLFYFFTTGAVISKTTMKVIPPIVFALIVNSILNIIITPAYGFAGTAWVTTITYFSMALSMYLLSRKSDYLALEWKRLIRLIVPAAAFIVMAAYLPASNTILNIGLRLLMFLTFPLSLVLSDFVDHDYRKTIKSGLQPAKAEKEPVEEKCVELLAD